MALKEKEELIPYAKAGLSMLSSMVAEPVSGWAGILSGGSLEAIARAREAITYVPVDDPKAMGHMQSLGYAMEPIGIAADELSRKMGDTVYEATGSETLAAAATAAPEGIMSLGGLRVARKAIPESAMNPDITPDRAMVEKAFVRTLDPFNLHKGKNPLKAEMFVGENAVGIPPKTKKTIKARGESGVGWRLAPDGKMRFQTSDKAAKWKEGLEPQFALTARHPVKLGNVLDHPELFKMYPELSKVKVRKTSNPRENGHFSAEWDKDGNFKGANIALKTSDRTENEVMGTLLHEIQHWVQTREGFSPGSSHAKFENIKKQMPEHQRDMNNMMQALGYMDEMESSGMTASQLLEANRNKISLASAKLVKEFEQLPETRDLVFKDLVETQEKIKIIQRLKKTSDGWSYDRTLGEMEARDVTDMYNRERLGMDLEQTIPTINRRKTEVGGAHEGVIIDPQTESLVLPPSRKEPMSLREMRNVN